MKNKNGFIATGLIYTFFLLFLTLFLSSITNHIKNKISLGYIEDDIKESLNTTMYVRDFEPGDQVGFVDDCSSTSDAELYVVASVVTNDQKNICVVGKDCLIFYSHNLYDSTTIGTREELTLGYIKNDISSANLNETYIDKILYKFNSNSSMKYNVGTDLFATIDPMSTCYEAENEYCTVLGKIVSESSTNIFYRVREVKSFDNNKLTTCKVDDNVGVIYVKK